MCGKIDILAMTLLRSGRRHPKLKKLRASAAAVRLGV